MEYYIQTEKSYFGKIHMNMDELLAECVQEIEGQLIIKPAIVIYGKTVNQQRNIGFFTNESIGYYYYNKLAESMPVTPHLSILISTVNTLLHADFNGILVNEYPDGNHYIGKHSDDERALSDAGVVSVSFGASRKFRIRDKLTNNIVMDIPTNSREIWIMGGDFQKEFTHEVPVEKKIKSKRISFTFRKHLR